MLTLITRGCNAMLPQSRGIHWLLVGLIQRTPDLPRLVLERLQFLSPRAVAAVARHRRP